MKEQSYAKNVSFQRSVIEAVEQYQTVTGKGYSRTLNLMVLEWLKYREVAKENARQEQEEVRERFYPESFKKEVVDVKDKTK